MIDIPIRTLTPLWTGGIEAGKVDRLHETGLLGSMRWWMEVLVRGLGGNACDPTGQHCVYDTAKPDNGICDVCRVFGATGWRRRFRLEIVKDSTQSIKDFSRSGALTLRIQSLHPDFNPAIIGGLIQFLADRAAIGARPQMGFGVIELANGRLDTQPLYDWLLTTAGSKSYLQLPSLRNIFLARIRLPNANDEAAFNLKYDLRRLFAADQALRHFIMGTVQGNRMASKIKVSRPYNDGLLRVWGWIPENATQYQNGWSRGKVAQVIHKHLHQNGWSRGKVAQVIHKHLQSSYSLQVWREFNSPRDSVAPSAGDAAVFLGSLLGLK